LIAASCPKTWRSAAVAFREVGVVEVREVLRGWLEGAGLRTVAGRSGVDRKTARRYVDAAVEAGLSREDGPEALTDELIGAVIAAVRPARPDGHGASWEALSAREEQIRAWIGKDGLSIVKTEELLARSGCVVAYRTLHRFAVERCGFRVKTITMRVAEGEPGVECQIDFAQMGLLLDAETGRRRRVHALIFTAVVSRQGVHRSGRCPSPSDHLVCGTGRAPDPRDHRCPPDRDVRRGRKSLPAAGSRVL
jgi:hypothetical protein